MKKIQSFILLAALFTSFGVVAQTAQEVLDKFFEATGGKEAWEKVDSYTLTRSFYANAPTDYDTEVNVSLKGGKISRRKSIMKRDFFYVVDGNEGWLKIPMGSMDKNVKYTVKDLSAAERTAMQQEIKDGILPLLDAEKKGFKMAFEPYKTVGNKTLAKIMLTRGDDKIEYFFDKTTGLITKEIYTSPTLTETWDHVKYATTADGLKYPSESEYIDSKVNKKTTVTSKLEVNEDLAPALFLRQ